MTRAKGRRVMTEPENTGTLTDSDGNDVETKETGFYNIFDGTKGRSNSQYLDMEEREYAERIRARVEGREPETDYGKLPPTAGTPLVVESQRVDNSYYSNPSILHEDHGDGLGAGKDVDPVLTADVAVEPTPQASGEPTVYPEDELTSETPSKDADEPADSTTLGDGSAPRVTTGGSPSNTATGTTPWTSSPSS